MKAQLQPIFIKAEPSLLLMGFLLAIAMLSCAIITIMPLNIGFIVAICLLVIGSTGYYILRDALLYLPWSWQLIQVNSRGEITVTNKKGKQFKPRLCANSFIHEYLTILNFTQVSFKNNTPSIVLLNFKQDEIRKLRVWLRWFKHDNKTEIAQNAIEPL